MLARILHMNEGDRRNWDLESAVSFIERGEVIGYPTETVYGLGGHALDGNVVERIRILKCRTARKPLIVLVSSKSDLSQLVDEVPSVANELMRQFWPGPLTLVFRASASVADSGLSTTGRIAVRISSDAVCNALLRELAGPLISTSANPEGRVPAQSAQEVVDYFGETIGLIIDGGKRISTVVSTVLDVSQHPPRLLREGKITREKLIDVIGEING